MLHGEEKRKLNQIYNDANCIKIIFPMYRKHSEKHIQTLAIIKSGLWSLRWCFSFSSHFSPITFPNFLQWVLIINRETKKQFSYNPFYMFTLRIGEINNLNRVFVEWNLIILPKDVINYTNSKNAIGLLCYLQLRKQTSREGAEAKPAQAVLLHTHRTQSTDSGLSQQNTCQIKTKVSEASAWVQILTILLVMKSVTPFSHRQHGDKSNH